MGNDRDNFDFGDCENCFFINNNTGGDVPFTKFPSFPLKNEIDSFDHNDPRIRIIKELMKAVPLCFIVKDKSTPEAVIDCLERGQISIDDLLLGDERNIFDDSMTAQTRISVELEESARIYTGNWYYQLGDPTCLPWSIANASLAIGVKVDPSYLADLLNHANTEKPTLGNVNQVGMAPIEAKNILEERYGNSEFSIEHLSFDERLQLVHEPLSDADMAQYKKIESKFALEPLSEEDILLVHEKRDREIINQNAALIKKIVDNGEAILVSVSNSKYRRLSGFLHGIALVGYRVNENKTMDVQVIDSDAGKIWMSVEHLSRCVHTSYRLKKKTYPPILKAASGSIE